MRRALTVALLLILLSCGAGLWMIVQAVSRPPQTGSGTALSAADMERARLLYRQLSPRYLREGEMRRLELDERDLELGINYLMQRAGWGQARVRLADGSLLVRLLLHLHGYALDTQLGFAPDAGRLTLTRVRLGRVPLPTPLVRPLAYGLLCATPYALPLRALDGMIKDAAIRGDRLHLRLVWSEQAARAALEALGEQLSGVQPDRLEAYRGRLRELATRRPPPRLAAVLGELFELARTRSQGGDPVAENRALLVALAEAVNGPRLGLSGGSPRRLAGMRLAGRGDFVEHLTLSAGLTAVAGEALADLAGLHKEEHDTRAGSGFSFTDLAVDRAGARLGRLATESEASARQLQELLAGTDDETLFLPPTGDLPEFLPERVFLQRYGGVGGEGYDRLVGEIERRIAALPGGPGRR